MYLNFRLKLNKARKTTRTFRYDLNQIPYDYMVEVTNKFKGLALIEYLKNYGRRLVTLLVTEAGIKTIHKKKKCKKAKWLSEETLQIAVKSKKQRRKKSKGEKEKSKGEKEKSKGEKERYTYLNGKFQRKAKR